MRQIRRSSIWTTLLIVFIMTLTFLNLVVISGILVGLIEGSSVAYRGQYSGDMLIIDLPTNAHIEEAPRIIETARSIPGVTAVTGRYLTGASIEANYQYGRKANEEIDQVATTLTGIDPTDEQAVTKLFDYVAIGQGLDTAPDGSIIFGSGLLEEYMGDLPGYDSLSSIEIGSKVRVRIGEINKEYTVAGILRSKIETVDFRAFIIDSELRNLLGRDEYEMDEIAIITDGSLTPEELKERMLASGLDEYALIQTWEESQGTFFRDIKTTFNLLGAVIGSIGLLVASITVFIVIFINAVTRQRYIGILKAIGIEGVSIEFSYMIQSMLYGLIGGGIGFVLVYSVLVPWFDAHPINFPFSDGILAAPLDATILRFILLLVATIIAGYLPARIIVSKNTLKSLLGR